MAEDDVVLDDETSEDPTPEENESDGESSDEDASAEEPPTTDSKKPREDRNKAQERIRDVIASRKKAEAERDYWRNQAESKNSTLDGVTDDGIDPQKFAKSLQDQTVKAAVAAATQQATFQAEIAQVRTDPLMAKELHQIQVSNLIGQGYSPSEALSVYKEELKELEADILASDKSRRSADAKAKASGTVPSGTRAKQASSSFTMAEIDKMDTDTYRQNQAEIKRQMAAGLIK